MKASTVFGRENFETYIRNQIKNKNLVRIKNRSIKSSERNALIAKGYRDNASIDSISQDEENATSKHNYSLSSNKNEMFPTSDIYGKDIALDIPIQDDIALVQADAAVYLREKGRGTCRIKRVLSLNGTALFLY